MIVATDDARIVAAVESFGGTGGHDPARPPVRHRPRRRGRPVARRRGRRQPAGRRAADRPGRARPARRTCSRQDPTADMATLAMPITSDGARTATRTASRSCATTAGRALYFSRSPIPFVRDGQPDFAAAARVLPAPRPVRLPPGVAPVQLCDACRPTRWSSWKSWNSSGRSAAGWTIRVGVVAHAGRGAWTRPRITSGSSPMYRALIGRLTGRGPA